MEHCEAYEIGYCKGDNKICHCGGDRNKCDFIQRKGIKPTALDYSSWSDDRIGCHAYNSID